MKVVPAQLRYEVVRSEQHGVPADRQRIGYGTVADPAWIEGRLRAARRVQVLDEAVARRVRVRAVHRQAERRRELRDRFELEALALDVPLVLNEVVRALQIPRRLHVLPVDEEGRQVELHAPVEHARLLAERIAPELVRAEG